MGLIHFIHGKTMKNILRIKSASAVQVAGLVAAGALFVASCASIPAPTEQMTSSRAAVAEATNAGSGEYAPRQLKTALEKMGGAEQAMTDKNYEQARSLAEQAQVDAQLALATTRAAKAKKAADALHEDDHVLREEMNRNAK
jgi:PBP1b-binding outer membrane lipoprotein LpoB